MKKIVCGLVMLALVFGSVFAADVRLRVKSEASLYTSTTEDPPGDDIYFTNPPESISDARATGHNKSFIDLSATGEEGKWGFDVMYYFPYVGPYAPAPQGSVLEATNFYGYTKIGDIAKILLGRYTDRGSLGLLEDDLGDDYKPGIWYVGLAASGAPTTYADGSTYETLRNDTGTMMGQVTGYLGSAADIVFSLNEATHNKLDFGVRLNVKPVDNIAVSGFFRLGDSDLKAENTALVRGSVFADIGLSEGLKVLAGIGLRSRKDIFDLGIDLRGRYVAGPVTFSTHNNISFGSTDKDITGVAVDENEKRFGIYDRFWIGYDVNDKVTVGAAIENYASTITYNDANKGGYDKFVINPDVTYNVAPNAYVHGGIAFSFESYEYTWGGVEVDPYKTTTFSVPIGIQVLF